MHVKICAIKKTCPFTPGPLFVFTSPQSSTRGIRELCIVSLPLIPSVLIDTEMSSFSFFFSDSSEAVAQVCFVKKVFLEISQNS